MARLSVSDLNNLSGMSNEAFDIVYKEYRKAHTKLLNDLIHWSKYFNGFKSWVDNIDDVYLIYKKGQEVYYRGSIILDSLDLFDKYSSEFTSILYKANMSDSEIRALNHILNKQRKVVIEKLSECYGIYSEAFKEIEEENYEG